MRIGSLRFRPTQAAGGSPANATASTLVVRYPGAIDTPPTLADGETPLASQYPNYLAQMIMAIESEIGPIFTRSGRVASQKTLMDLLGTETARRLSCVLGNDAGKMFGLQRASSDQTGDWYGAQPVNGQNVTAGQGSHPTFKNPAAFGSFWWDLRNGLPNPTNAPMYPRGQAIWTSGATMRLNIAATVGSGVSNFRANGATNYFVYWLIMYVLD